MLIWVRSDIFEPTAFTGATDNVQQDTVCLKMADTRTSEEEWRGTKRKHPSGTPAATVKLKFGYAKNREGKKAKPAPVGEQMDCFIAKMRTTRIQLSEENRKVAREKEAADKQLFSEIPITFGKTPCDMKAQKGTTFPADIVQPEAKVKRASETEEEKVARFSNSMKDAVRTVCQICKKEVEFNHMRIHTRKAHEVGISEYKRMYGNLTENLVEAVYHKCTLCSQVILLNGDVIATHAKKHRITHKEYNSRFIIGKKENLDVKQEENLKSKHEELMNNLDDNLTKLKTEKATGAELRRKLAEMSSDDLLKELDLLIASC